MALLAALAMPTVHAADGHEPVILMFGDSVSAGYGIRVEQGWVNLLAQKITQSGYGFRVINASVSGETTAGGLSRLPHALDVQKPTILILELGGNDGLRSLPLASTHDNLEQMIKLARTRAISVLLVGMRMPPNYVYGPGSPIQTGTGPILAGESRSRSESDAGRRYSSHRAGAAVVAGHRMAQTGAVAARREVGGDDG